MGPLQTPQMLSVPRGPGVCNQTLLLCRAPQLGTGLTQDSPFCCGCSPAGKRRWKTPMEVQELALSWRGWVGLAGPQRSLPTPAALCNAGRMGVQTLGGTGGLAGSPPPELLLAWPGTSGLSLRSHSAGWLQDEVSPPGEAAQLSEDVPLRCACLETRGKQTVPGTRRTCPALMSQLW